MKKKGHFEEPVQLCTPLYLTTDVTYTWWRIIRIQFVRARVEHFVKTVQTRWVVRVVVVHPVHAVRVRLNVSIRVQTSVVVTIVHCSIRTYKYHKKNNNFIL